MYNKHIVFLAVFPRHRHQERVSAPVKELPKRTNHYRPNKGHGEHFAGSPGFDQYRS
jgi:hypothetical protein